MPPPQVNANFELFNAFLFSWYALGLLTPFDVAADPVFADLRMHTPPASSIYLGVWLLSIALCQSGTIWRGWRVRITCPAHTRRWVLARLGWLIVVSVHWGALAGYYFFYSYYRTGSLTCSGFALWPLMTILPALTSSCFPAPHDSRRES